MANQAVTAGALAQALEPITERLTQQNRLLAERAQREEEEHVRKQQESVAKFRELSKEEKEMVELLKKYKAAPQSATWRSMLENVFKPCAQRMSSYSQQRRVIVLNEMLTLAELHKSSFDGSDEQLQLGALWQSSLLHELDIAQPNFTMLELASEQTLETYWQQQHYLFKFIQAAAIRQAAQAARGSATATNAAISTLNGVMAGVLLASIPMTLENEIVRAKLEAVTTGPSSMEAIEEICTKHKLTRMSTPMNRKAKTAPSVANKKYRETGHDGVDGSERDDVPMVMATSVGGPLGRQAVHAMQQQKKQQQAAQLQPVAVKVGSWMRERAARTVAKVSMLLRKPSGDAQATDVVVDSGSTVTLVSEAFVQRANGHTAVNMDSDPLQALRVAGAVVDVADSSLGGKAVTLEVAEQGGRMRTLEAFVVRDLPCDLLAGVDTLGPVMDGTTIQVFKDGSSSVQFGTDVNNETAAEEQKAAKRARQKQRRVRRKEKQAAKTERQQVTRAIRLGETPEQVQPAQPVEKKKATVQPAHLSVLLSVPKLKQKGKRGRGKAKQEEVVMEVRRGLHGGLLGSMQEAELAASPEQAALMHAAARAAAAAQRRGEIKRHEMLEFELRPARTARGAREAEPATVLMTFATLDEDVEYAPAIDVAPLVTRGAKFKFAEPVQKLVEMIKAVDSELPEQGVMPATVRAALVRDVLALDPPLASKDAPPHAPEEHFIDDDEAVLHLRFKPNAQIGQIGATWRPMQPQAKAALDAQVAEWRRIGVMVKPDMSETECVSLPLVVPKVNSDGERTGWRIAIDTRRLNEQLTHDRYSPEPRLVIVRRLAQEADAVTSLDGSSLYTQFRVAPADQRFLVVQTSPGVFDKMVGAPFGVSQMPGVAQHYMEEKLVAGDSDKHVFIDDLMIAHRRGGTWAQATEQLLVVLRRAKELNIRLNVDKFQLFSTSPVLLGYLLDCKSHSFVPNPAKMQIIYKMLLPRTNKALERALAMAAAWAHALPGLQLLTQRLRAMVVRGAPLKHTADGQAAWTELVELLARSTALRPFDPTLPVQVWSDAAIGGLGWCITQMHDGKYWLVQAGGRKTQEFERRLSIPELEALAVRHAFQQAPDLLVEVPAGVTWMTDSQAIALARGQKSEIKSRATRQFFAELSARNFGVVTIKKIAGESNSMADAISRQWEDDDGEAVVLFTIEGEAVAAHVGVGVTSAAAMEPLAPAPATERQAQAVEEAVTPATPLLETAEEETLAAEPPKGVATTDKTRELIDELLVEAHVIDRAEAERRRWAIATVKDDASWMANLRKMQKGKWVHNKQARVQVEADGHGRLFVVDKLVKGGEVVRRLVVPGSEMYTLMHAIHQGVAHKKEEVMVAAFNKVFFNPTASRVARDVIAACLDCQRVDPRRIDRAHGTDPTAWGRFEMVSFDVFEMRDAGPFKYGLMVIDWNTGMFEVEPMMEHTADAVEKALRVGWLARWPHPKFWKSDNAQELVGKAMQQIEIDFGIRRVDSAVRNPMGNGVVERQIGLFKLALRKVTPIGTDWTSKVNETRYALICSVSKARGGFSPMELATGVSPVAVGKTAVQLDEQPLAEARERQTATQRVQKQQDALKEKLANAAARANVSRLARNQQEQSRQKKDGVMPHVWKVDDVVWIDAKPFAKAGKWDSKVRRSRALIVTRVDTKRLRVKVIDFETRLPWPDWQPFRLLSAVRGGARALKKLGAEQEEKAMPVEEPKQAQEKEKKQKKVVVGGTAPSSSQPMHGMEVPCSIGVIVNVTWTTSGRRLLVAAATKDGGADLEQPFLEVEENALPAEVVQRAVRAKRMLDAPKGVRRGVVRGQSNLKGGLSPGGTVV